MSRVHCWITFLALISNHMLVIYKALKRHLAVLCQQQATVPGCINPSGNYCIGLSCELWSLLKLGDISPRNTLFSNGRKKYNFRCIETLQNNLCWNLQTLSIWRKIYTSLPKKFSLEMMDQVCLKVAIEKGEQDFDERWCLPQFLSSFVFPSSTRRGWREQVSPGWQSFQDWRMWRIWGVCLWYGLFGKKAHGTVHCYSSWAVCVSLKGRRGHPEPK